MTDEYAGFRLGNFVSPLVSSTDNSLLQDADPALFATISYYQAVLQTHLGARFDAEVTRLGLPSSMLGGISRLVLPYDPVPMLQRVQLDPPWLAVFRSEEQVDESDSRNWYRNPGTWHLRYCLPCLTPAQFAGLYPMLRAIVAVLIDRTEQGYDPTYQSGLYVWRDCGMQEIGIKRIQYGALDDLKTELFLPAVQIDLSVIERKNETPGLSTMTEADTEIDVDGVAPFINTEIAT